MRACADIRHSHVMPALDAGDVEAGSSPSSGLTRDSGSVKVRIDLNSEAFEKPQVRLVGQDSFSKRKSLTPESNPNLVHSPPASPIVQLELMSL
ncbi:hypothetical protein RRG08_059990 [Elysia crispata]|uniref:Uncharacterized protein n=1 Tax=Elysia crispata TaxID=231223 RepID=A0AAE0YEQ0_9GAST|nr:hypothetical protein RRG08_059990 [Elysia crispata]